jgi:branched-chain amino acid transport system permease protein
MAGHLPDRARALTPSLAATAPRFLAPLVAGIALALLAQLFLSPLIGSFYEKMLINIGINVILAVSLNMVNGFTGQFSIGHAGFMAVGGYTSAILTYYLGFKLFGTTDVYGGFLGGGDLLFIAALLVGGAFAALAGYVVGLPSLRLRGDYLAIVTLGFGEIVRVIFTRTDDVVFAKAEIEAQSLFALSDNLGGALGFTGVPIYTTLFWVYVFVTLTLLVSYRLKESSTGRAFLSVRENEIAAEAMGIDTTKYKVRAFVMAAFFAGIAGGLFAHLLGSSLNPREFNFQKSFDILIMVVLGGMGSVSGTTLAAIILTILPELLRSIAEYRMIAYSLALIIMMIVRPQGLLGIREIWERRPGKRP